MAFSLSSFSPFSAGSPFSALFGDYGLFSNPTGAWDKFKNGDTNEVNYKISQQNLAFQRENFEYQKALQQKIFDREDSAYARTVADMRNAGLSPLVMSGTNGAGEAIATTPLHNDYQHTDIGGFAMLSGILNTIQQLKKTQTEIDAQQIENNVNAQTANSRISFTKGLQILQDYDQLDSEMKADYNNFFGIHSGMSEKERLGMVLRKVLVGSDDVYGGENIGPTAWYGRPWSDTFDYTSNMNIKEMVDKFLSDKKAKKDNMSRDDHLKALGNIFSGLFDSLF